MTQLETLIQTLCPNGVKFVKLGEVGEFENIGVDKKSNANEQKVTLLNYVDIYKNKYIDASIPSMVVTAPDKKITQCNVLQYDIFVTPTSETRDDIGHAAVVLEDLPNVVYSYHIMRFRLDEPNIDTAKFIRYLFETPIIQKQIYKAAKGLTRFGLSKYQFAELQIPLPPLAVQSEIVRLLDKFTLYKSELAAELAARLQQYEYYRDQLLTFDDSVEWKKLGDVASIRTGTKPDLIITTKTDFEYINAGTTNSGYTNLANSDGDAITTPSRGQGGIGFVGYQRNPFWLGPLCYKIVSIENKLLTKYLYYYLVCHNDVILKLKNTGGVPALNRQDLIGIMIPIPPVEIQQHIISTLDRFDKLCHDIREGLPAEIDLRQKQYEHYRDKLLTF